MYMKYFKKILNTYLSFLKPIIVWMIKTCCTPIIGFYNRRWTQYTETGKIALCCIAKMENDYIRFFVEYYKNLHFDKIFIYDNNDIAGEKFEYVINDYIQSGFVEIVDFRGRECVQMPAYQDCYDRFNKQYDWIAFLDIDEFLAFSDGSDDIHDFLKQKKFLPYQLMHINWRVYGDNDLLDNDGRNVVERFVDPLPDDNPVNRHIKSLIRGGLSYIKWENPHTPFSDSYHCCNPIGESVNTSSPFQNYDFSVAYIRHYSTKTIGEWVKNKMKRGTGNRTAERCKEVLTLDFFFAFNKKTEEKLLYAESILNEDKKDTQQSFGEYEDLLAFSQNNHEDENLPVLS